ncbi:MAG: ABC transporter substrate-binding protein [Deltaproteobacteria bacterium]|nr:ABC transporter substrate-binding protein [Deltaproteobacteria bacterium]
MANVEITLRPVKKALATVAVFVLLCPLALSSSAAESLKVVYPTISAAATPLWIGKELGFFKKNSLDVDLVFIEGSPRGTAALLAGNVDLIMGSGNATVQAVLAGAQVTLVSSLAGKIDFQLMVPAEIKGASQLKGGSIASSQFGTSPDFAVRYAMRKLGLDPVRDVTILQMGNQATRLAALTSGKVQAAIINAPATVLARKRGFHALVDLAEEDLKFQQSGMVATKSFIKSRPDTLRSFLKALMESIHLFKMNKEKSLQVMALYTKTKDLEALEEGYQIFAHKMLDKKPYVRDEALRPILDQVALKKPETKGAKPSQFYDHQFIEELDKSGFIDSLYRR